jgi:glucose-1-phosphate adenylyltransferase
VVVQGRVERSVLSPGVVVDHGAVVRDSVIMHRCRIEAGAVVDRAILDKNVWVRRGARIGVGEVVPNQLHAQTLSSGVTVVGKGTTIPEGITIGRGCIVGQDMTADEFGSAEIPSGSTVTP